MHIHTFVGSGYMHGLNFDIHACKIYLYIYYFSWENQLNLPTFISYFIMPTIHMKKINGFQLLAWLLGIFVGMEVKIKISHSCPKMVRPYFVSNWSVTNLKPTSLKKLHFIYMF